MHVVGVDIGGTHIKSAVVNLDTGVIDDSTITSLTVDNKGASEDIFQRWSECINLTLSKSSEKKIKGVGLAMPGPFNYRDHIALFRGNDKYEALYGLNVSEHLIPLLNISEEYPLRYHNDASCFAIGEDGYGNGKAYDKFISITLGTGFGSAFIDSAIPIVVRADVPEDGCLWHLPFKEGLADAFFSTRWFLKEYYERTGISISGVKELADKAPSSTVIQKIFYEFGISLGQFLSPWIQKFGAEAVIMGGNISKAHPLFAESLRHILRSNGISNVPFGQSLLHEDAAIIGSARLVDNSYYNKVKDFLPTK